MAKKTKNPLLTLLAVLLKSTKIFAILKSLKYMQIVFSLLTMVFSIACYSVQMGIRLATGLVILLFLHEMGHVIAMGAKGYKISLPVFIPFLGAVIFAPKFDDQDKEAYVAYGGVFIGTIFALLACIPYFYTGDKFWIALSELGIFINLFNMIPMSPLDGGRITQAIHPNFRYIGLLILFIFTLMVRDAGILIIWILALTEIPMREKIKVWLMVLVFILMCLLSIHSTESKWVIIEQLIFGGFLTFLWLTSYLLSTADEQIPIINKDDRPRCSKAVSLKWGLCWAGLAIAQIGGLIFLLK